MAETIFYGTGRRKRATARVWLFHGQKGFSINGQEPKDYFGRTDLPIIVEQPLKDTRLTNDFRVRTRVEGGGVTGQAGAIRLGIARALLKFDERLRPTLRQGGCLTRDPREKERKKFGRKGARRRFQYTKR